MMEEVYDHYLWKRLNQKYKIAPISPASYPYCSYEQISKINGINLYNAIPLLNKHAHPFHSNSDELRLQSLKGLLYSNEENMIIWCTNGGYGSSKLIEYLESQPKPDVKKVFVGYSDITALHLFFSQKWGWETIHGACLCESFKKEKSERNFLDLFETILNDKDCLDMDDLTPMNKAAKELPASFLKQNVYTGGNLAIIQTSIGTSWEIETHGKILILEDVGESGYKIDRMLYHLVNANKLNGVKGIIFGDFSKSDEFQSFVLGDFAKEMCHIPVFQTNSMGHGVRNIPFVYRK
ncbi:MAG: muramoyltetrapeptide carboxypeptidase [Candidatus Midichloriaceae bacterium]|jgi:muramoyltetrapeptide carboxypeptidase